MSDNDFDDAAQAAQENETDNGGEGNVDEIDVVAEAFQDDIIHSGKQQTDTSHPKIFELKTKSGASLDPLHEPDLLHEAEIVKIMHPRRKEKMHDSRRKEKMHDLHMKLLHILQTFQLKRLGEIKLRIYLASKIMHCYAERGTPEQKAFLKQWNACRRKLTKMLKMLHLHRLVSLFNFIQLSKLIWRCFKKRTSRKIEHDLDVSGGVGEGHGFNDTCLLDVFQLMGIPVTIDRHGPFKILSDGNDYLRPFGLCVQPTFRAIVPNGGDFVIYKPSNNGSLGHFQRLCVMNGSAVQIDRGTKSILDFNGVTQLTLNPAMLFYEVLPISATNFIRGGWMSPWYDASNVLGGMLEGMVEDLLEEIDPSNELGQAIFGNLEPIDSQPESSQPPLRRLRTEEPYDDEGDAVQKLLDLSKNAWKDSQPSFKKSVDVWSESIINITARWIRTI